MRLTLQENVRENVVIDMVAQLARQVEKGRHKKTNTREVRSVESKFRWLPSHGVGKQEHFENTTNLRIRKHCIGQLNYNKHWILICDLDSD